MTSVTHPYAKSTTAQLFSTLIERLFSERPRRRVHLDARDLPDHLKRDLGLLDGQSPPGTAR